MDWAVSIHLRGSAGIGLGTTIKYLRRTASGAAGNGLSTMIKYLVNKTRVLVTTGPKPTYRNLDTISAEPPPLDV
jgi:hypothetical protein